MRKYIFFIIILAAIFCPFLPCYSEDDVDRLDSSQKLEVLLGETKTLKVNNPKQVKIGNPALLDVVGASKTELLLNGLKEGQTMLTIVDRFGERKYTVQIVKEDLNRLQERIRILLDAAGFSNLGVRKGEYEGKIFILGEISTEQTDAFNKLLEPIKDSVIDMVKKREELLPSVEIDVAVYEVKKTVLDTLGFQWTTGSLTFTEPSSSKPVGKLAGELVVPTQYYKLLKSWGRSESLSMNFDILESRNELRTLARPKLVVQSGKEASFLVGGEKPIIVKSTTTAGSGSSTTNYDIEYKEFGVKLNFKPIVKEKDIIQISLETEISEVDNELSLALGDNISTPGMKKSTTKTELTALDGQTVLLAGLIKTEDTIGHRRVKGLASLPIIGALFRSKSIDKSDREIVISLKPTIIWPLGKKEDAQATELSKGQQVATSLLAKEAVIEPQDPLYEYSRLVQSIINSRIQYSPELRRQKIEGTVKLSLHLLSSGKLLGAIVMKSSGSELLDQLAEMTVKELSPYPAFPSEIKLKELWIDIPIIYKIE